MDENRIDEKEMKAKVMIGVDTSRRQRLNESLQSWREIEKKEFEEQKELDEEK